MKWLHFFLSPHIFIGQKINKNIFSSLNGELIIQNISIHLVELIECHWSNTFWLMIAIFFCVKPTLRGVILYEKIFTANHIYTTHSSNEWNNQAYWAMAKMFLGNESTNDQLVANLPQILISSLRATWIISHFESGKKNGRCRLKNLKVFYTVWIMRLIWGKKLTTRSLLWLVDRRVNGERGYQLLKWTKNY